ncbi:SusC/RagA family TonB-linked outer membrane protein, partial [Bacteroides heparinolyticus]
MKKEMIIERINSRFMSIYLLLCVFLATEGSLISLYAADYRGSENEQKVATAQTVKQVLDHIERNSNYVVLYSDNVLPELEKKVSVNTSGKAVTKILQELSSTTNLEYKMNDRQITVAKKSPVTAPQPQQNATIKVTGQVVDENGETIPGANVVVKGQTGIGTVTDLDGKFTLDVPQGSVLVISFIGYVTQEHSVKAGEKLTVKLIPDAQALEEVVVVGYGVQKKESLTGAMQTVSSSKLKDITTPSVENMLNGKAAGVYVAPGSGQPGASGAVVIRGQVTLSGGTAPLWVIDGVIVGSSAGQLNPNDIETMTILKDASSTAIYGSEGANGVIVVTTKSGKADKMSINISTKLGISNLNNGNLEMMNGAELYDLYSSFSNSGNISFPRWNPDLRNSNFSWWDLATKTGFTQDYNISLQGGSEKLNSFVSVGVYDETGSVKGYDYTRYNFRTKTTYKPFKWLTVKPSLSGARRNITDTQYSVGSMYSMFPWDSPYDENSNLVPHRYSGWVNNTATNYLLDLSYGNKSSSRYLEFMGNFDFDIHLTDWLTLSSVNSYKLISYASESYADPRSNGGKSVQGRVTDYRWEAARRYTNQILRFNKNFDKHSIQALAAHEFKDYWSKTLDVNG